MGDTERREQILQAGMRVFSQHGFHKATIKQIAKEAELKSSALIYWYFRDKKELLIAVITELSPLKNIPFLDSTNQSALMDIPPRVLFATIGQAIISLPQDTDMMRMFRLYLSEALRTPEVADMVSELQQDIFHFMVSYMQHQINAGRLRPHNPQIVIRALMGTLMGYLVTTQVFTKLSEEAPAPENYIQEVIDTFMKGLEL